MASKITSLKKLAKKVTGKDIKGNTVGGCLDAFTNAYTGGGGSGGDGMLVVNVTSIHDDESGDDVYTADKTFAEILQAYPNVVICYKEEGATSSDVLLCTDTYCGGDIEDEITEIYFSTMPDVYTLETSYRIKTENIVVYSDGQIEMYPSSVEHEKVQCQYDYIQHIINSSSTDIYNGNPVEITSAMEIYAIRKTIENITKTEVHIPKLLIDYRLNPNSLRYCAFEGFTKTSEIECLRFSYRKDSAIISTCAAQSVVVYRDIGTDKFYIKEL